VNVTGQRHQFPVVDHGGNARRLGLEKIAGETGEKRE
jgi:hypothetical protein